MSHSTGTTRKQKDKKKYNTLFQIKFQQTDKKQDSKTRERKLNLISPTKKITTLVNITLRTTDLIKKYGERIFITATTYAAFIST